MSEAIANQAERIETLRHVISHLHQGHDPEQVRGELRTIVRQTDAVEIAAMEQQLIDGGMAVDEIRSMCDMHSQLTREILVQRIAPAPLPPGHPAETFASENIALRGAIAATRKAASALGAPCPWYRPNGVGPVVQSANQLGTLDAGFQIPGSNYTQPSRYAKAEWWGLFDASHAQVGDYLIEIGEVQPFHGYAYQEQ